MASVRDVAAYILSKRAPMTAMKLQKLAYYSQAWSLVWDEEPLFSEAIQAWANGPVAPELYLAHRRQFTLEGGAIAGDAEALTPTQKETVDKVLEYYGDMSAVHLSQLTHRERPWSNARKGCEVGEICSNEISHASMASYYESLI